MLKDIFVNMDWEEKCVMWGHQRGGGEKAKKKRKEILLKETRFELITLMAQMLENLPVMWETQVRSLDQEDPPVEEMATHSSVLAWRIPWTEEPGGLQSMGLQRAGHN